MDQRPIKISPHAIYPYPARFSPNFARQAIEAFSSPGDFVLDPFCGGGTAIVEALATGRKAAGFDVSTLAAFLARTKTTPISIHDKNELALWLKRLCRKPIKCPSDDSEDFQYYTHNLPPSAVEFFGSTIHQLASLPRRRQQNFARLVLLAVGQSALESRRTALSALELRKEFSRRLLSAIDDYMVFLTEVAGVARCARCRVHSSRRIISRSSADSEMEGRIPKKWLPAKLILTSPPYPGVHVVYHGWQVFGRRVTPAPFWLANQKNGMGESHYLMGPRRRDRLEAYFSRLTAVFSSMHSFVGPESLVVQLVAFSSPDDQLPLYLASMRTAGFAEMKVRCKHYPLIEGRLWRDVPGRKWWAHLQGHLPPSREVLLIHKPLLTDSSRCRR